MKINDSIDSVPAIKEFINSIKTQRINELSKKVGFVKRSDGKLLPTTFVKAMTLGMLNVYNPTLHRIAESCESFQEGLRISEEAIFQRLKQGSDLLKELFKSVIDDAVSNSVRVCSTSLLNQFSNVYICDSTLISLTPRLLKFFPSSNGKSAKSSLCLQTVFSLTNRRFKSIEMFRGNNNDIKYSMELGKFMNPNDLIIFDLGYKNKLGYKEIMNKSAFFLTRAENYNVYQNIDTKKRYPRKEIDMVDILQKSNGIVDMEVLVGHIPERRIKCRFVAIRLPEEIANERIRKARKRSNKANLGKKELELLKWNTFLTNATTDRLPVQAIYDIYKMRWQIEILFKACKSYLGLKQLGIGGKDQTECLLYGKLITAVLLSNIYSTYYSIVNMKYCRELSILRFFSFVQMKSNELVHIMWTNTSFNSLVKYFDKAANSSLYDKRKRKSSLDNLKQIDFPNITGSG